MIDVKEGIHLSVIDSIFKDNNLIHNSDHPNIGIIYAEYGGIISIFDTYFVNNSLFKISPQIGITSLVYFGGIPYPRNETILNIVRSSFIKNKGMTSALLVGGLLYNDGYVSSGNYEIGNIFTGSDAMSYCPGIIRIRRAEYVPFEECIVRFDISSSLVTSHFPSITPVRVSPTICWSTDFTEKVMRAESFVSSVDISIPRIYRMCNNEIAEISDFDYDTDTFDNRKGKVEALSIWNSNVHIICGIYKNDNNCTFTGGTFQIRIFSKTENVKIQGFKFTDVSEANILVYGADVETTELLPPGASILVKDCHFFVSIVI